MRVILATGGSPTGATYVGEDTLGGLVTTTNLLRAGPPGRTSEILCSLQVST